jgi:NADH-ubiquinone oxidoreductase chain 3
LSFILRAVVLIIGLRLSKKINRDQEKFSPFECGFIPKYRARLPFSMRFFLLGLIFLVFDVELILNFPYTLNIIKTSVFIRSRMLIIFLMVLLLGVFHE